jgi:hypothetical protein
MNLPRAGTVWVHWFNHPHFLRREDVLGIALLMLTIGFSLWRLHKPVTDIQGYPVSNVLEYEVSLVASRHRVLNRAGGL